GWGRHLSRLWNKFAPATAEAADWPVSVLELGAGTCPFASRKVFPRGARVVYTDLSPFMLRQDGKSRGRAAANALALPFKSDNGRGPFQLCLMIYDAVNYLMREEDVSRCLSEALRVLAPG